MSSASESPRFLPFAGRSVRLPSSPPIGFTSDCLRKSRSRPASAGDWPEGLARRGDWTDPGSGRDWTVTGVMAAPPPPLRDRLLFLQRVSRWPRVVPALPRVRGRQRAAGRGQFPETRPRGRWARGQSRGQRGCRAGRASGLACLCHSGGPWSAERGRVSPALPAPRAVDGPQRPAHPTQAQPQRVLSLGQTPRPPGSVGQPGVRVTGPACHPGSCPLDHRPSLGFTPTCSRPVAPLLPFSIQAWCPPCWRQLLAKDTPSPALPLVASSAAPHPPEGHRR